jgi:hypothetical protein
VRTALAAGAVVLAFAGAGAWGQQYPIDGGFEAATADPAANVNGDASLWTTSGGYSTATLVSSTTISRTGGKCVEFKVIGTAGQMLQTKQTKFDSVTKMVVQYYYKDAPQQTDTAATRGGVKYAGQLVYTGSEAVRAAAWTKKTDVLSVSGTPSATDFAFVRARNAGSGFTSDYYIDDVAVYDGATVDETPPDPPTSPSVVVVSPTSLTVSWTAPATGVDGGGYLVVRGTSDPTTAPNTNGVYAVANTVASGKTVVYVGASTSFTDSNLATGTTFFYRIYTYDKAFNYSAAAGGGAVSDQPCWSAPAAGSDSPICAGTTLHLTASSLPGAVYAWTGPNGFTSSVQNPTLPDATIAAAGVYSVTVTSNGCTSSPGTTTVVVKVSPTGGADTLATPKNTAATISSAKLKANDSGTGLSLTAVSNPSVQGGTVSLSGVDGTLTYTPRTDYSGSDSFTYTLSNDQGCAVQVPVIVTIGPGQGGSANVLLAATVDGNFVVRFAGIPGETYTVETNSVFSGPGWTKLGTENFKAPGTDDAHPYGIGVFQVTDPLGSSSRYYRTVWPAH